MAPLIGYSLELNSRQDPGDPNLQCSPATPWSIFVFFATNYLAHCATVKNYPGSSELDIAVATALALFLPSSGITRALFSIVRRSRFKRNRNPLERAALAGALRMVVRNEKWIPMVGDRIKPKLDGYFTRGPDQNWSKVSYDRYGRRIVTEKTGGAGTVNIIEPIRARDDGNDTSALPRSPISSEIRPDNTPEGAQKPVMQNALRVNRVRVSENLVDDIDYDNTFSHTGSFQHHVSRDRQNFHGKALLPPGYSWAEVHGDAKLSWIGPQPGSGVQEQDLTGGDPNISSNYNWIQSLVAIFQAGSAGWALYRARGNQIQRYGYAAFGLTVVPYLIMSVINLLAQIATADYPNVFMVGSPEMDEARRHGGVFDGVVGHLEPEEVKDNEAENPEYEVKYTNGTPVLEKVSGSDFYPSSIYFEKHPTPKTREYGDIRIDTYTRYRLVTPKLKRGLRIFCFQFYMLPVMLGCLSLVVVGAMTHFANGESTMAQRGWIMSWLVVGIACGPYADSMSALFIPEHDEKTGKVSKADYSAKIVAAVLYLGICCVPAIGGFAVVAGMLREYGICESND